LNSGTMRDDEVHYTWWSPKPPAIDMLPSSPPSFLVDRALPFERIIAKRAKQRVP
jgi:hypothetical protein